MYYAKSKPTPLTIKEHTDGVVEAVRVLKKAVESDLTFCPNQWELLEIAALYHDIGKYSTGFQQRIQQALQLPINQQNQLRNYPHNYISTMMLPLKSLSKKGYPKNDLIILTLAIGYHHERSQVPHLDELKSIYEEQLAPYLQEIQQDFQQEIGPPNSGFLKHLINRSLIYQQLEKKQLHTNYILLKGLLQKTDRAASAKLPGEDITHYIERATHTNVGKQTEVFIVEKYNQLRPLQLFVSQHKDKNIILIAQTGSGKTEAALIWIDAQKGFITLPLRVSLNALYLRVTNKEGMNYPHVGLLHSTALDYLIQSEMDHEQTSYEQLVLHTQHTERLAEKLTFSTVDQLFKFPLLYQSFEIELATLAYSKVVIDEIQAYDPKIVAILLKGLKMIDELGGKWMIMTATMPAIFLDKMQELELLGKNTVQETILLRDDRDSNPEVPRRHYVEVRNQSIHDFLDDIQEKGRKSKVLVVVNTVKQALALYKECKKNQQIQTNLLHSQFTPLHRTAKEKEIYKFAQLSNEEAGVWICTQIVEASLDVDFDYLFTEAATADALFQRFGRCNRAGKRYNGGVPNEANIFIAANLEEVSGIDYIYEKKIVENSLQALTQLSSPLIDEQQKIQIVKDVFSQEQLEDTKYLQIFEQTFEDLEGLRPFELKKEEAQKILRDITTVPFVAGQKNYEKVIAYIEQYNEAKTLKQYNQMKKIQIDMERYLITVNPYRLKNQKKNENFQLNKFAYRDFEHIYFSTDVSYSKEQGLDLVLDETVNKSCE